jgi:signal transduction histidine kinase
MLQRFDRAFPIELADPGAEGRPLEVLDAALAGQVLRGLQGRLRRRDGGAVQLQVSAAPLESEHGRIVGCVITLMDTTERERLLADVERLVSELKQAVAVRDQFISVASHELKTPLTALMLSIESASRNMEALRADGELFERKLAAVSRQGQRLSGLVRELLDVSRLRTGRLQLQIEPVDICAVVREVVERHAQEATWAGCSVEVSAHGPIIGAWDRSRVDQVATNLISNAIKYGSGKPIVVAVEATTTAARLTVTDHGIGVAAKDQERIFEEFERAVDAGHYGGMGLGLWIAREIVVRLGGTIQVQSSLGEGASFMVELPR